MSITRALGAAGATLAVAAPAASADTHSVHVIGRVTTNGTFRQSESLAYTEVHDEPGRAALLRMAPHPGATIVDERS
jgi:hypothetical protein